MGLTGFFLSGKKNYVEILQHLTYRARKYDEQHKMKLYRRNPTIEIGHRTWKEVVKGAST